MKRNVVICADAAQALALLPEGVIDLTVTSPPYDATRQYEGYTFDFEAIGQQLWRVTRPGGVLVWVVADQTQGGSESGSSFRQALRFKEIGFKLYDTMIYEKANPQPRTHRRYESAFEYMFVLSKGRPVTFNGLREPCRFAGVTTSATFRNGDLGDDSLTPKHTNKPTSDTKLRSNIWRYQVGAFGKQRSSVTHPGKFPYRLAEDHILSWSNPGDLVLDPMAGSGTTLLAARNNGRDFLGVEISASYCEAIRALLTKAATQTPTE